MVSHGINGVAMERGILVVDATVGQEDDVVFPGGVEHGVVVNVVIVTLDHQSTRSVPDDVVMHGTVGTGADLIDGRVEASAVLDDVVNPVVRDFCARGLALHDLHHGPVGLQVPNVPHFVVEHLGRITDGQHGGGPC